MKTIYFDNAATTSTDPRVLEAMIPFFSEKFGNPESPHHKGKEALIAIDNARETVAGILNCHASEIYFFGSGTEANNAILFGIDPQHLIVSQIEHSSILEPAKKLNTTFLPANTEGLISTNDLKKSITKETQLISIMYANNEIGTVEPIQELAKIAQENKIPFHTDACQAAGALTLDTQKLGVDAMTLNGSKIYGPKGIGVLFVKRSFKMKPMFFGGGQEKNLRPGTHNVPAIVGFAKALELTQSEPYKTQKLRDKLINILLKEIPNAKLNGPFSKNRLPNNINICIPGIEANELILYLDSKGICISSGAACSTGRAEPSHVLQAIGLKEKEIYSSVRISLSRYSTDEETEKTAQEIVRYFRNKKKKATNPI